MTDHNIKVNSGNIIGSFNNTIHISDEDEHIMHWLSPLEPQNRHQSVRTDRLDGVGDWLLQTNEFRKWRGSEGGVDEAILFCYGNPGVGKTHLSSLVIDSLCDEAKKEGITAAVAGLYCDFLAQGEQTITNMMGAILKQLLARGDIPNSIREAFQEAKGEFGRRRLRLPALMGILKTTIAALPQVFICIDALDECLPKYLPELLKSLKDVIQESPRTRIFLTGRPHVTVDVQRVFTKATIIPINPNIGDIRSYLKMKLDKDSEPEAMSDALRADILRIIPEKISGIFLLVSLKIDDILGEVTARQRRRKLDEITQGDGLNDAYTTTLKRLKAQPGIKSELGLKVLMWVSHSERPLRSEELCHALGVEIGSPDLDPENIPGVRTLLACCLGLVTVDASSSTVRPLHYTLQEYLSNNTTLLNSPHATIAEVCLTYLDFPCVRNLSPTLQSAPSALPLLEYASYYWGKHTRREMTENVKTLTLKLLDGFDRHISAKIMLSCYNNDTRSSEPEFDGVGGHVVFTGLHGAAFLGISGILTALLEMKRWDVNATDSMGNTALLWAARMGHEAVVKILLEQGNVNPEKRDTQYGIAPLSLAAKCGHSGVVKIFLDRGDTNPNVVDDKGQTPLLWASRYAREEVVKLLLERADINPDAADDKGQTPLLWASWHGHEGVVKLLLERADVNTNTPDTPHGRTPLSWAADRGRSGAVKMLLDREDTSPNTADHKGQTPLLWASWHGHEGVVKLLLERADVDTNTPDIPHGRTPLSWAADRGRSGAVKMLLDREDTSPNTADYKGQTPLLWASWHGHEGVVKLLLERADVNTNTPDTPHGRTPLSWAAERGHEGVVKTLLDKGDTNPNAVDVKNQTPLLWASCYARCEGVVKALLGRVDTNPNTVDHKGQTPLLWASWHGHERIVKLLLERADVDINTPDTPHGRTPLSWAAGCGHWGVVKMLLDRQNINS